MDEMVLEYTSGPLCGSRIRTLDSDKLFPNTKVIARKVSSKRALELCEETEETNLLNYYMQIIRQMYNY